MAARVYLDIAIGDRAKHETDVAAHERACTFFTAVSSQYGWSGSGPQDLDADAREVFQEAYASDRSWAGQGPALLMPPQLAGGRLVIALSAAKEAPKACENFRCLCTGEKGVGKASGKALHYKGVRLHRVQKGFVAQGGDVVKGDGSGGDSIYGGKFKDEAAALKLRHDTAGVVGFANSGKHSNTSQFYVTLAPAPQCDGKHVVVGRVVEGLEVLQQLEELAASADGTPRVDVVVADCGALHLGSSSSPAPGL
ncbi:peptidylprolyl cis-trans cyclophilin-type domain containing [Micractinium conductrix]|uniref:Peptidyl-prolyl cis-trans isomerase n=1 Tax=Micractinium conductrix TaxID=554055 RepID=A0A2P6VDP1_9CHLO|nr:peptidylprolyl cis-trans cyclophilin-type domain containing [Micractinium conductrix]|eukprot:PSC72208.1 peptidylprolyl cis-trans cyclophilin-type domain containing [Micractinium conductrix]